MRSKFGKRRKFEEKKFEKNFEKKFEKFEKKFEKKFERDREFALFVVLLCFCSQ